MIILQSRLLYYGTLFAVNVLVCRVGLPDQDWWMYVIAAAIGTIAAAIVHECFLWHETWHHDQ
jgi:hypothetical protein